MSDKEKIYQLFATDKENIQLGLQLLKGQPQIKAAIEAEVLPILACVNKKTLRGLPKFLADFQLNMYKILANTPSNGWEQLPFIKTRLAAVEEFKLRHGPPITIHESFIACLQGVVRFIWIGQEVKQVPKTLLTLPKLQRLWLLHNKLVRLPDTLGQSQSIHDLYLQDNLLEVLPESIGDLPHLRDLRLDKNQLKQLPESIGQLDTLRVLDVKNNQLQHLPDSLGQLTALRVLELGHNNITHFPKNLKGLENLQRLSLKKNPIERSERERLRAALPQCAIEF